MIYLCIDLRWKAYKAVYSSHINFSVCGFERAYLYPSGCVLVPCRYNAYPLKCIRHPLLLRAELFTLRDCHIDRGEGERDISCLDATNFLFMHGARPHDAHTCTHPDTIDRFIIACQESAGFTFQQKWTHLPDVLCAHPPHPPTHPST